MRRGGGSVLPVIAIFCLVCIVLNSELVDAIISHKRLDKERARSKRRRAIRGRDLHKLSSHLETTTNSRPSDEQLKKKRFEKDELRQHKKQKHKPLFSHPEVSSLSFVVFEQNTTLPKTLPHPDYDCHWRQHGKWDVKTPLRFTFDERGSGLSRETMERALQNAYSVWSAVSNRLPKATFRRTFADNENEFTPSCHRMVNLGTPLEPLHIRTPNYINEISFEKRKVKVENGVLMPVVAEIYVWQRKNDESKTITEMDVVLVSDEDVGWCVHDTQFGNPNSWIVPYTYRFDLEGILVKAFGHVLGLHQSNTVTHTMSGLYARDTCCKRSLECGDIKGIETIYGKSRTEMDASEQQFQRTSSGIPYRITSISSTEMRIREILYFLFLLLLVHRIQAQTCTDATPCLANASLPQGKCCSGHCVDSLSSQTFCGGFPSCGTNCGTTDKICCFGSCTSPQNSYSCVTNSFGSQCCSYPNQFCHPVGACTTCSANTGTCPGTDTSFCSVSFLTNTQHCGNCSNNCTTSDPTSLCCSGVCTSGQCGTCGNVCTVEQTCCSGSCVYLNSSDSHCASCGHSCNLAQSETCCRSECKTPAYYQTSQIDCGSCGNTASSTQTCCNGTLKFLEIDVANCGQCGHQCISPNNTCINGLCAFINCSTGFDNCHTSQCFDLNNDENNCGSCGSTCSPGQQCCHGQCLNPLTNDNHCGACDNQCDSSAGEQCNSGVCGCNELDTHCPTGMRCCNHICTFYNATGQCSDIVQFPPCEYDRTKVCARCLPHQIYSECLGTYDIAYCQVQLSSFNEMIQQVNMASYYQRLPPSDFSHELDQCIISYFNAHALNGQYEDPCFRCCQNEFQRSLLNGDATAGLSYPYYTNPTTLASADRCASWCWPTTFTTHFGTGALSSICGSYTIQGGLDIIRAAVDGAGFPTFHKPIEQYCSGTVGIGRHCKPHEADERGTRDCLMFCNYNTLLSNRFTADQCDTWYPEQKDRYIPDSQNTSIATCNPEIFDVHEVCGDQTVSVCGPYSTQTTVASCEMNKCLFTNNERLECLAVTSTCDCPGVTSRNGFRCGDPGFTRSLQCTNSVTLCGQYTRGCITNCYFEDGDTGTTPICTTAEDPFDSLHTRNTCMCIPGAAPLPPSLLALPCSGFPRPCTLVEELSCGEYRLSCRVFDDTSTLECTCHDGVRYNSACSTRPDTAQARKWEERVCELSSEYAQCGDNGYVRSCSVVCHPDVRQEQDIQVVNQFQLEYPFPTPNNCTLKLDSCVCASSAHNETLTSGQLFCHDPLQYKRCDTTVNAAEYAGAGCNLPLDTCRMRCDETGTLCVPVHETCYTPLLSLVNCETVRTGTSKRLCGHDVSTCMVWARSVDNGATYELTYNSTRNVQCTCLPPHSVFPIEYTYYSPCTSVADTNYYCTASETIQFCGIPDFGHSTVDSYGQWLNDKQEHRCLRDSSGLIPGTCPGNWTIRACTDQEVYEECPEPGDVMCTMRCSTQPGASCFRIGLCSGPLPCNSTDITHFCSSHTRSCSKYTRQTLEGAVISLVDGSCRCMNGYDGERCEVELAPNRACTVSESLQFCGFANHTLECITDFHGQVGSCICKLGYGSGSLPCSNHIIDCTNNDRLAYLGVFGKTCTLLCNDRETSCSVHTYECFANGFSLGTLPCGTDRVMDRMTLSEVLANCGAFGVSGFVQNVTQINGTVTRLPDPLTCVCDLNHFNDIDGVCRLTFPIQPCSTQEYLDYCSAVIPCYRKCYFPAPNQAAICDQYYDTSCFNQTYVGVPAPSAEAVTVCGPFIEPGATTATCNEYTNGLSYHSCVTNTFQCVCSVSSPIEFRRSGFRDCEFDYGFYYCDTSLPLYPPTTNKVSIQNWNAKCHTEASDFAHILFAVFDPIQLACYQYVSSNFYLQCLGTNAPDLTTLQHDEEHCYDDVGGTFVDWTTSRICSNSGGCPTFFVGSVCCGIVPSPWTLEKAQPYVELCPTGQTFNFESAACTTNPTGTTELVQYCGPNAKRCIKKCRAGGINCFDVEECVCNTGFEVETNSRTCRYDYPIDVCLDTPLAHRAQTDVCGTFGQTALERCIGRNLTVDNVMNGEDDICEPICQCRSGSGPTPASSFQCGGYDHPCDPLDVTTFCGTGYVSCTKRCEYPTETDHIGLRSYCVFNNGSCVLDPVATMIECTSDQRDLCGDAVASCTAEYSSNVFVDVHCTCTETGVATSARPCNEWSYWDKTDVDSSNSSDPLSCYQQCGPHLLQSPAYAYWDVHPRGITYNCAVRRYFTLNTAFPLPDSNTLFQELVDASFVVWNGTGWSDNLVAIKTQTWYQSFFVGRQCDCMSVFPNGPATEPGSSTQLLEVQVYSTYAGIETIIQGDYRRVHACFNPYIAIQSDVCGVDFVQCDNPSGPTVCCGPDQKCVGSVGSQTCQTATCTAGQFLQTNSGFPNQICSTLATNTHCGSFGHACASGFTCITLTTTLAMKSSCFPNVCPNSGVFCLTPSGNPQCCPSGSSCVSGVCKNGGTPICDQGSGYQQHCGDGSSLLGTGSCCADGYCVNQLDYSASFTCRQNFCPNVFTSHGGNGFVLGESCVDLQTSNSNCGACGNVCPSYATCVAGQCKIVCDTGQSFSTYGCCLSTMGCINSGVSFDTHQAYLLANPPLTLHSPYNGLLCSGRGTMAAAPSWTYDASKGPRILNWDGNYITGGSITLQLPQASSVCSCYPGWSGTYCEIQSCCRISPLTIASGIPLCSQSPLTTCKNPLNDNALSEPLWSSDPETQFCNPQESGGGPNCCEYGTVCNSTSWQTVGDSYCLNGGKILDTARGTICICPPGYENDGGTQLGTNIPSPYKPPGLNVGVEWNPLGQCNRVFESNQTGAGSPCNGNGVTTFQFDPVQRKMIEFCVCNEGWVGAACTHLIGCGAIGCDSTNNHVTGCDFQSTVQCPQTTCSCPSGTVVYGNGCADVECLNLCVTRTCTDPNACPCETGTIPVNMFGITSCIDPICAILKCATQVECPTGYTFNSITKLCEVVSCPSDYRLDDTTNPTNPVCKKGVCTSHECPSGDDFHPGAVTCTTDSQCSCDSFYSTLSDKCRTLQCPCDTIVGSQCLLPDLDLQICQHSGTLYDCDFIVNTDTICLNTACTQRSTSILCPVGSSFAIRNADLHPVCIPNTCNCGPCESFSPVATASDITPPSYTFTSVIRVTVDPVAGNFSSCSCQSGSQQCGDICCPNGLCVNNVCTGNCTVVSTPRWLCVSTTSGFWSDDPNSPGQCCDKWTRNGVCNGIENAAVPQTTYLFNGVSLTATAAETSGYRDEPICVCDGSHAGPSCQVGTCPLDCSGHGTCVDGRCQQAVGPLLVCGNDNQYTGCACQFDQLSACAPVNATGICTSAGNCEFSYTNQTLELGCTCNAGRLGEFCQTLACGVANCNPPFGTCNVPAGGGSGTCTCLTQGTTLRAGPNCEDDVTTLCGQLTTSGNERFLCNLQGTCAKNNITNIYGCTCTGGWTGATCGTAPCATPCNHGRCISVNNAPVCQCALGWNALPSNNPCSVSVCSGAAAPESDVFTGSVPQCLCNNRTLAYPGCTSLECPFSSDNIRCGKVHPLVSVTETNTCTNGVCTCHWSSVYNNVTGVCDPRCSPAQTGSTFTQTQSVNFVPNSNPRRFQSCTCKTGFYAPSGCYEATCLNGGVFIPQTGLCACRSGFSGARCADTVCNGHGVLNTTNGQCVCFSPYNGVDCGSNYCQHGGVPDPLISGDIAPNQRCRCPAAWSGLLCTASMCSSFGSPNQVTGTFCDCSTPVFGGTYCNVTQCNPSTGVYDSTFVRCNCTDLQYFGVLCQYRKCGPVGEWNPTGSPTNTSHPANCTCTTPVVTHDPVTGNCTKSLCGPYGSLSSNWQTCNCQANVTRMIGRTGVGHSIICEPICLHGGFYDDTTQACICVGAFGGTFCETDLSGSSSSSSSSTGNTALSSTALSSTAFGGNHSSSTGLLSSTGLFGNGTLNFPTFNVTQPLVSIPQSTLEQSIQIVATGAYVLVNGGLLALLWASFAALI